MRTDKNILSIINKFLKVFFLAFILPIVLISLIVTILPKRKNSFELDINTRAKLEEKFAQNVLAKPRGVSENLYRRSTNIKEIEKAIISNKVSELSILRMEDIGDDIISQETFVPQVKRILINHLYSLMTLEDWQRWRENIQSPYSSRTQARIFVDNILTVNFQLGRFLETSGLLFSALYISTSANRVFNIEEEIYNLLEESNYIFSSRKPAAISSRVYIDTLINEDLVFNDFFQKIHTKLIVSAVSKKDKDLNSNFLLLSSISPKFYSAEVLDKYKLLFDKVTNSVSPRLREEIRLHYFYPERAKELSDSSFELENAIHNLYFKCIEHLLSNDQLAKARSLYLQLASFSKNKGMLDKIKNEIDAKSDGLKYAQEEPVVSKQIKIDPLASKLFSDEYNRNIASSSSLEWYSFFIALLVFVSIIFKTSRNFILAAIAWFGSKLLAWFGLIRNKAPNKALTEELSESIKSGKTVPMSDIAKSRAANLKKVVNN